MNAAVAVIVSAVQLVSTQVAFVGVSNVMARQPARLLVTTDGGAHFRVIGPRVSRDTVVDDVDFLDPLHGWVVVWNVDTVRARLYRTADGGHTWRSVEVAGHGVHAGASDTIQFLDRLHGWLVVQEPTAPFATLYVTRDGGAHWRTVGGLPEVAPVRFQSTRVAWQAGGYFASALVRTTDGGRHWRRLRLPRPASERGARVAYAQPGFVGGAVLAPVTYLRSGRAEVVVFRSADGGASWHAVATLAIRGGGEPADCLQDAYSVAFATPTTWWLAGAPAHRPTVYRTTDAGRTWRTMPLPTTRVRGSCALPEVRAAGARVAWVSLVTTLLATRDGGATWRTVRP
jgi:photosystem II stability/assembly factor-like uncharacterized protein